MFDAVAQRVQRGRGTPMWRDDRIGMGGAKRHKHFWNQVNEISVAVTLRNHHNDGDLEFADALLEREVPVAR